MIAPQYSSSSHRQTAPETCYNGKHIVPKGWLILKVESGGWTIRSVPFIKVDDQKINILGRNFPTQIGIRITQDQPKHNQILNIHEKEKNQTRNLKNGLKNFQQLCVRIGKSKTTWCEHNSFKISSRYNKNDDKYPFINKNEWKRILWHHGYARRIPEGYRYHIDKLWEHVCLSRWNTNYNKVIEIRSNN